MARGAGERAQDRQVASLAVPVVVRQHPLRHRAACARRSAGSHDHPLRRTTDRSRHEGHHDGEHEHDEGAEQPLGDIDVSEQDLTGSHFVRVMHPCPELADRNRDEVIDTAALVSPQRRFAGAA